jgi:hypothetical protein
MDADLRQQPVPDKGAHDPDQEVADDPEPRPPNDFTSQPASNDADEQYDQQAFIRHMHWSPRHLVQKTRLAVFNMPIGNASMSSRFLDPTARRGTRLAAGYW